MTWHKSRSMDIDRIVDKMLACYPYIDDPERALLRGKIEKSRMVVQAYIWQDWADNFDKNFPCQKT